MKYFSRLIICHPLDVVHQCHRHQEVRHSHHNHHQYMSVAQVVSSVAPQEALQLVVSVSVLVHLLLVAMVMVMAVDCHH
jgi:hypothetical protein